MAITNGRFTGEIEGRNIFSYSNKLDYNIEDLEKRKDLVSEILNLDEIGSKDKFWMDVWDMANCKVSLNVTDTLWTDTNVAQLLESMGTYLIAKDESEEKKEKRRFNRPKKETSINNDYSSSEYEVIKNDKNYRLAPPDEITNKDYRLRNIFSGDYNHYKEVIYKKYIDGLKEKIVEDSIKRYGFHDGVFEDFSCSKLIEEDKWNNLKRLELEKIELLNDAKRNLDVLKQQNKDILNGTLYLHRDENGNSIEEIEIYKYEFINRIMPCNIQLAKSGYSNSDIKSIEDKFLYQKRIRSYGVGLRHISNNISDIKDYMLSCKLAYTNKVCISPDKNGVNMDILEYVDYENPKHIESILYLQGNEISYESDMSIISYDITKVIRDLRSINKLDDKDIYIIDGIRHKITQEVLAKELNISQPAIKKRISKITNKIIDKFKKIC